MPGSRASGPAGLVSRASLLALLALAILASACSSKPATESSRAASEATGVPLEDVAATPSRVAAFSDAYSFDSLPEMVATADVVILATVEEVPAP